MATKVKLKPAKSGLIIRDPHTRIALPPEGSEVTMNNYWVRRLSDGDVVQVEDAPAKPKPAEKAPANKSELSAEKGDTKR